ncbi:hypothetical protein INN71_10530 [Nocardioides sp. ChNu-153]|uniref:hypothetical protein n=1 Tax=unclassified Nocardioides TaxID=2615069 RepID=UPI0024054217|nr:MULTISPECIES: hypothetical protein [unclassified Nocardioides]MDF9717709.1 endonuclease domain-containing protein [Nocardioides sp. ChNu-99]MDN7121824.1 hypothetical protein [Nocardioides sp. ChNu-153]
MTDEPRLDAVEALSVRGGVATRADLLTLTTRHRLQAAVADGRVVEVRRSVYRLPVLDRDRREAARLRGVLSHLSAARDHGWEVPPDERCWVTVHRGRHALGPAGGVELFYADLAGEHGPATSPVRTVLDCGRRLPFPTALAVADSALRHGVERDALDRAARQVRGKGGPAVRRVVAAASPLAANPFESVLRGIALEAGLDAVPQGGVEVGGLGLTGGDPEVVHPDVVDRERRIVLEADSWEFHSDKEAFQRDCWRYTVLVAHGWLVLRFTWWQVMLHPGWVRECVRRAVDRAAA